MLRFLARLYPARWRERYGDEFMSLLDDYAPRLGVAIVRGKARIYDRLRLDRVIWLMEWLLRAPGSIGFESDTRVFADHGGPDCLLANPHG